VTDEGIWISDEDYELLQQAKEAQGTAPQETAPKGVEPVYLKGTLDAQLSSLRNAGDAANYERAREAAMQAALDRGDEAEFERITNEHRPAGMPQYLAAEPEPTEEEVASLQQIFDNPAYQSEMQATDGNPERMNAVYEKFKVPKEARLTVEPPRETSGVPLYGPVARANGGGQR
jgi:hypothetical protein